MQGLPERWVNMIIADPDDANHAYIAFSGFRQGNDAANVYETTDGGASWQNVSHNMPNGPVEMIEYDPVEQRALRGHRRRRLRPQGRRRALVQDQRRDAAGAGPRRQALRRQQALFAATFGRTSSSCRLSRTRPTAAARAARCRPRWG